MMTEVYLGLDELRADPNLKRELYMLIGQFIRKTRHHDALVYTTIWFPQERLGTTNYVVRALLAADGEEAFYATGGNWDIEEAIDAALKSLATQLRSRLLFLERRDHEEHLARSVV